MHFFVPPHMTGALSLLQLYCLFVIVSHISTWLCKATEGSPVTTSTPPSSPTFPWSLPRRSGGDSALLSNGRTFTTGCGHLSARWEGANVNLCESAERRRRLWLWSVSPSIVFFKISWSPPRNVWPQKPPTLAVSRQRAIESTDCGPGARRVPVRQWPSCVYNKMVTARSACVAFSGRAKKIIQMAKMINPHTRRLCVQISFPPVAQWLGGSQPVSWREGGGVMLVHGFIISVAPFSGEEEKRSLVSTAL